MTERRYQTHPDVFVPLTCHACACATKILSLCLHCRRYWCKTCWERHHCTTPQIDRSPDK